MNFFITNKSAVSFNLVNKVVIILCLFAFYNISILKNITIYPKRNFRSIVLVVNKVLD